MEDNLGLFLLTWRLYRLLRCTKWFLFDRWMKAEHVTFEIKFTEQYFSVVLFIHCFFYTLYGGSSFWVSLWTESLGVTIQMRATKWYFPVVMFIYAVQGGLNFWVYGRNLQVSIEMTVEGYWAVYFPVVTIPMSDLDEVKNVRLWKRIKLRTAHQQVFFLLSFSVQNYLSIL